MKVSIEIDRSHPKADGTCAVSLRVYAGKLHRMPLGFSVQYKHWDPVRRRVKFANPRCALYNATIEQAVHGAETLILGIGPKLSASEVIRRLTSSKGSDMDFFALARARVEALILDLGYNTRVQRLSALSIFEEIRPGLAISDFTPQLVEELDLALLKKGNSRNTVTSKMKKLAATWRDLRWHNKLSLPDPWEDYIFRTVETKIRGFFRPDVELIEEVDLSQQSPNVQMDRDAFVLMFYFAGMRPCDLVRITEADVQGEELYYQMHKTNVIVRWGIHPKARLIIDRYKGQGVMFRGSRVIWPWLREVDTLDDDAVTKRANAFTTRVGKSMKIVAALCGLPPFSGYWARHSASTDALVKGVKGKAFQDMMGHKQSRNSDVYARRVRGSLSLEAFKTVHG